MSSLLTLISSLPFVLVFSALLLAYFTPTLPPPPPLAPLNPHPTKLLPLADFLPPPTNPHPHRYRTLSPSDLGQPRKLFSHLAKTVASTPTCVTAPQSAARPATHRPEQPKTTTTKKKKTVSFALENNTTLVVDRWIKRVSWAPYDEVVEVKRWIEPHGRHELHFPNTVFIRDGPDTEAEDDEGDVGMLDA